MKDPVNVTIREYTVDGSKLSRWTFRYGNLCRTCDTLSDAAHIVYARARIRKDVLGKVEVLPCTRKGQEEALRLSTLIAEAGMDN